MNLNQEWAKDRYRWKVKLRKRLVEVAYVLRECIHLEVRPDRKTARLMEHLGIEFRHFSRQAGLGPDELPLPLSGWAFLAPYIREWKKDRQKETDARRRRKQRALRRAHAPQEE
jgi:hypothetical protein